MILIYFASGECIDDVVNNRTNHQFTSAIVVYFMNRTKVGWIIKRTIFTVYVCLNHSWRYEHNQFERRDEKPRHQRQSFSKVRQFLYLSVYLSASFIKYTVSFTTFQRLKSVLWKKLFQCNLRSMYLFCPKFSKNHSRKSFIKKLLDSILYVLSFSVHNVPSHFYDLILVCSDCY